MGFLPIILFTLAFIFLWGIVNYNSLRKIRNEITQLQESVIDISLKRKNAATKLLSGINPDKAGEDSLATIRKIADGQVIDKENINQMLRNEANRTQLASELASLSQMSETTRHPEALIASLSELTHQLKELQPRLMDLLHNYHDMVTRPPSRFIARLFGFGS